MHHSTLPTSFQAQTGLPKIKLTLLMSSHLPISAYMLQVSCSPVHERYKKAKLIGKEQNVIIVRNNYFSFLAKLIYGNLIVSSRVSPLFSIFSVLLIISLRIFFPVRGSPHVTLKYE
jgi:hypothetical protein